MDLRALECFVAVARHGHFRRAAESLYLSQSAVSQQVARLEAELGLVLLTREPSVAPTPAGEELLVRAEAILADVAAARAAMDAHAGTLRGTVRLATTALDAPRLARVLATFGREHATVRVVVETSADVAGAVQRGAADVGAAAAQGGEAGEALAADPLVLAGPPGEPAPASLDALRDRPAILATRGTALREAVDAACGELGFGVLPRVETDDPATTRLLVRAGLGLGVLPASWLDHPGHELATTPLETALSWRLVTAPRPKPPAELLAGALRRALA